MDHEATMKKMDMELQKMNQDLQIRLAEFTDNRETKKREYEDSKKFRSDAFSTVSDIVAAAAAGFSEKIGGSGVIASNAGATKETKSSSKEKSSLVTGFECKDCGTPITVPDGATEVACPNEQCGAKYTLVPDS